MKRYTISVDVEDAKVPEFEQELDRWTYLLGPTGPMCRITGLEESP